MIQGDSIRNLYIYNVEELLSDSIKPVLVVSGADVVEFLRYKLMNFVIVSFMRGVDLSRWTDWSWLSDWERDVYLCADDPYAGSLTMDDIGQILSRFCGRSRIYIVDSSVVSWTWEVCRGRITEEEAEEIEEFICSKARIFESDDFARYYHTDWPDRAAARFARYMTSGGLGLRYLRDTHQLQIWRYPCWEYISQKALLEDYLCGEFLRVKMRQLRDDIDNMRECVRYVDIHRKGFARYILSWVLSFIGVDGFCRAPSYELACSRGIIDLRCGVVREARAATDNHTFSFCGQYEMERTEADVKLSSLLRHWIPDASEFLWLRLVLGQALHGHIDKCDHFLCIYVKRFCGAGTFFESLLVGALGSLVKRGIDLSEFDYRVYSKRYHDTLLADMLREDTRFMVVDEVGGEKLPRQVRKSLTSRDVLSVRVPYSGTYITGCVKGLLICIRKEGQRLPADDGLARSVRVLRLEDSVPVGQGVLSLRADLKDPYSELSKAGLRWLVDCARDYWVATKGGTCPLPGSPDSMRDGYKREKSGLADVLYDVISDLRCRAGSLIGLTTREIKDHVITAHRLDDYNIRTIGRWLNNNGYVVKQRSVGSGERRSEVVSEPELSE